MKRLYYVVEKETKQDDSFEYTTGNKTITVYEIDDPPIKLSVFNFIETVNFKDSESEIEKLLEKDGYDIKEYNLIKL